MSSLSTLLRSTLLRSTLTILALSCTLPLILPFQAFSANPILTYPSDTPSGQIPGGTFNTYFSNMFGSGCTTSLTAITGFNYHGPFNTQNGIPICTDFTEPVSTLIDTAITEHHTSVFGTGNISDLFSCKPTGTGKENACYGTGVLQKNTLGQFNTALGHFSLQQNTTGNFNTTVGTRSLTSNISGNHNTALGVRAGLALITGSNNLLLGYQAGKNLTTGNHNIALGTDTLFSSSTGSYQLNIGNTLLGTLNPTPTSTGGMLHVQGRIYTSNPTPLKPNELASKAYVDSKLRAGGGGGMNMDGVDVMVSDAMVGSDVREWIHLSDEYYAFTTGNSSNNREALYCAQNGVIHGLPAGTGISHREQHIRSIYKLGNNRIGVSITGRDYYQNFQGSVYSSDSHYFQIFDCSTGKHLKDIGGGGVGVPRSDGYFYLLDKYSYIRRYLPSGELDTTFTQIDIRTLGPHGGFRFTDGQVVFLGDKIVSLQDFSVVSSGSYIHDVVGFSSDYIIAYNGDVYNHAFQKLYTLDAGITRDTRITQAVGLGGGKIAALRSDKTWAIYEDGNRITEPRMIHIPFTRIGASKIGVTTSGDIVAYGTSYALRPENDPDTQYYDVWRAVFPMD